jgi:hypothetical protein
MQGSLFDTPVEFADKRLDPVERPRLNRQCLEILRRLYQAPLDTGVANTELTLIALRYSARIGELRAAGLGISIVSRDAESGVNHYAFASEADRLKAGEYL